MFLPEEENNALLYPLILPSGTEPSGSLNKISQ